MTVAAKALVIWLGILVLAILNGGVREAVLVPLLGRTPGYLLSGISLAALIVAAAYLALPWLRPLSASRYVAIGLGWLLLTLGFEFSFGHVVLGKPWSELLAAYRFEGGNIWPLVLLITGAAPYLVARLRGWIA